MAYSVSKAAGLHLMRCLAYTQGPKVRVNAVQPGLLMTEWGKNFPQEAIDRTKDRSKLKVAVGVSFFLSFLSRRVGANEGMEWGWGNSLRLRSAQMRLCLWLRVLV